MRKRTFTPEFKAKVIIELLKGEKELSQLASEHEIAPNQLRNWKSEFLENAANAFDNKKDEKLKESLKSSEAEKDDLYKKVGQLTTQVDWLKKNLKNSLDLIGRVNLLRAQKDSKELPLSTVAELLDVNRTSAYYKSKSPSETELAIKDSIDRMHTDNPSWGSRQISKQLQRQGFDIGRLKTRRYMQDMDIHAIYPKPNLSKPAKGHKIYPYLLRNVDIVRPNQAWSIDITYIRLKHGFVYLTAIIDWHSRLIVGWELDDTLSTNMVKSALEKAFSVAKPETLNSDQGDQFTGHEYISFVENHRVKISMDGKSRWADNIMIERWFRTLKYDEVYLKDYVNIRDARKQIGDFIHSYNFEKLHSALGYQTPAENYYPVLLGITA
ncbi:IS3 family transposase [Clostridium manihotivorum]|uniref:Transposase n=2 Tax=Clostridium manihotivorum TaxID=2320868 RepID=A0A3R5QYK5_9CLOT|nr:IS3 family transposase [Clostridium manihotivorum]QAA32592.1 transposase [Clostridium manihotivorum]QAA33143.1 transposase [Clostridium manihotivorum]